MDTEKLESQLQQISDAVSGFDDTLTDLKMNSVPSPNMADISRWRILEEIDRNTSNLSKNVGKIREQIEQIKTFNGIL